jgi:hypothetical protein
MEPEQAQKIAVMAGAAAVLAALATGRLPRWLRITLVSSLAALACAAGLLGSSRPTTLDRAKVAAPVGRRSVCDPNAWIGFYCLAGFTSLQAACAESRRAAG